MKTSPTAPAASALNLSGATPSDYQRDDGLFGSLRRLQPEGGSQMKKILMSVAIVLGFCVGQPVYAGIGFGIPLPFPFLVWTPSGHCDKGNQGKCGLREQQTNGSSKHPDVRSATGGK